MAKSKWGDIWLVGPTLVVWHIWKEIKRRIFKEVELSTEQLISKIKVSREEVVNGKSVMRKNYRYNNWDRSMEIKWSLKDIGPVVPSKRQVDMSLIKWTVPPKDWVKLNFDGASKGNPGRVGFEAILRDENGRMISGVYDSEEETEAEGDQTEDEEDLDAQDMMDSEEEREERDQRDEKQRKRNFVKESWSIFQRWGFEW
ncbi:uncharacterized protein LOC131874858 [Cryptomeria japonica]|uniref:uncharacterized protein LOC131874858 n=1 Tax=Cryptomeria japonica TaxID=3369 RepID=UPI0027DA1B12|nr:uncharacterized protein LOC131874858 [Cryptomeria japonica]